jgi:D-sedoheptulose 7-phosphate isomerase
VTRDFLADEIGRHRAAVASVEQAGPRLVEVSEQICARLSRGGIVYTCGNGGSAADAQHLAGELIGRYKRERRPLGAVALATDPSVVTCIANDYRYEDVFARQAQALCRPDDVLVGFTTSGRSASVLRALQVGREVGAYTVAFTGAGGAGLADLADVAFVIDDTATARVQEMHVLMLHLISEYVDRWAAGEL